MTATKNLAPELQRILWACYDYWQAEPLPADDRTVCFSWVEGSYRTRFGGTFHQSRLAALAKLGYLVPDDSSRGGGRRYYRLTTRGVAVARAEVGRLEGQLAAARSRKLLRARA